MIYSQKEELAHISFPQWDKTEHLSVTPPAPPPIPVPPWPSPPYSLSLRLNLNSTFVFD